MVLADLQVIALFVAAYIGASIYKAPVATDHKSRKPTPQQVDSENTRDDVRIAAFSLGENLPDFEEITHVSIKNRGVNQLEPKDDYIAEFDPWFGLQNRSNFRPKIRGIAQSTKTPKYSDAY